MIQTIIIVGILLAFLIIGIYIVFLLFEKRGNSTKLILRNQSLTNNQIFSDKKAPPTLSENQHENIAKPYRRLDESVFRVVEVFGHSSWNIFSLKIENNDIWPDYPRKICPSYLNLIKLHSGSANEYNEAENEERYLAAVQFLNGLLLQASNRIELNYYIRSPEGLYGSNIIHEAILSCFGDSITIQEHLIRNGYAMYDISWYIPIDFHHRFLNAVQFALANKAINQETYNTNMYWINERNKFLTMKRPQNKRKDICLNLSGDLPLDTIPVFNSDKPISTRKMRVNP